MYFTLVTCRCHINIVHAVKIENNAVGDTWCQPPLPYGNYVWPIKMMYRIKDWFIHLLILSLTCIVVYSLPL